MATIYIPNEYQELAERLGRRSTSKADKPIFNTYMQLMVFAAMIGFEKGAEEEADSKSKGAEVYSEIFERNSLDGVAYLLAIQDTKGADILRDKAENECWKVIENYAALGLGEINNWLLENPGDVDGVETLINKIKSKAADSLNDKTESDSEDVVF
jgi:dnd system-associated protein 4